LRGQLRAAAEWCGVAQRRRSRKLMLSLSQDVAPPFDVVEDSGATRPLPPAAGSCSDGAAGFLANIGHRMLGGAGDDPLPLSLSLSLSLSLLLEGLPSRQVYVASIRYMFLPLVSTHYTK
jgi:hypothetical protein